METNRPSSRDWHPIEEAIVEHIDRYGLTTPAAAHAAGVKGMNTLAIAEERLNALVRRGDLIAEPLPSTATGFVLSPVAQQRRGREITDRSGKPLSQRMVVERFAFLSFCCLHENRRTKLTHAELRERFADLYRPGSAHHYYVTTEDETPRLGFLRVDIGSYGRWDRIIAKVSEDLRHHLSHALVRTLLEQQAFELTLITPLPEKARRVQEAMAALQNVFPIPVRSIAVPELVNFIRPAPD